MLKSAKIAMAGLMMMAVAGLSACATTQPEEPRYPSNYEEPSAKPAWDSKFYRNYVPGKASYY